MPTISVVIPVYNGERTILETIKSVLNQTFSDFELIIINDGSHDQTLEMVERIQDSRLKVFSYANAGLSASRNRGVYHACGEYISFIDADDLWTPDKLEAQLRVLQENPKAGVAYSWTNYIDESGHFCRRGSYITATGNVHAKLLLVNFLENGSNPLICRQALIEVGGFEESLLAAEDWDMWLRLAARYDFVCVPSPQILYRVSANSMSTNILKQEVATLAVIEQAFAQAPESLHYLKPYSVANIYKYLTSKALEGPPERKRSFVAARFLLEAVRNDPSLLRSGVLLKVLFKIAVITLLLPKQAQVLLTKVGKFSNIQALYGYIRLELP
jgi:glycosyltransferase involved in cell wall biosynthesis